MTVACRGSAREFVGWRVGNAGRTNHQRRFAGRHFCDTFTMAVKLITADGDFPAALKEVGTKLLVVDFFAHWFVVVAFGTWQEKFAAGAARFGLICCHHFSPSRNGPSCVVCAHAIACRCGPCHKIAPVVEQLAGKYPDVAFFKVDVDRCPVRPALFFSSALFLFVCLFV